MMTPDDRRDKARTDVETAIADRFGPAWTVDALALRAKLVEALSAADRLYIKRPTPVHAAYCDRIERTIWRIDELVEGWHPTNKDGKA